MRRGATNDIDTIVHTHPPHSPKYQTWHACEDQTSLRHAIRGDMYALSPHLDPNLMIAIQALPSPSQGRAPEVSGLYDIITSKRQHLRTRVSNLCTHTLTYTDAPADITTRRLICLHNFGSCSSCSSSACRRILVVVVREEMHTPNIDFRPNVSMPRLNVVAPRNAIDSFNLLL